MTTCTPRAAWGNLLRRLHYYIGLFVGPFIFFAALTGTLYVATPQLEKALYHHALHTDAVGEAQPLAEQIAVAEKAVAPAARKTAAKKPAAKKAALPAAKKAVAKKTAAPAARKTVAKPVAKKVVAKKATAKKVSAS